MRSRLGTISILLLLIPHCFAAWCRTCRGQECQQKYIELRACNKFSSTLPFGTHSILPKNKENLEYGCLKLEYTHGKSTEILQTCIIAENIKSYCEDIAKKISHTSCNVETPINLKTKRGTNSLLVQPIETTNTENRQSNGTYEPTTKSTEGSNKIEPENELKTTLTNSNGNMHNFPYFLPILYESVNKANTEDDLNVTTISYDEENSANDSTIYQPAGLPLTTDILNNSNFSTVQSNITLILSNNDIFLNTTKFPSISTTHKDENTRTTTTISDFEMNTTQYNDLAETTTKHSDPTGKNIYSDNIEAANFGSSTMQPNDEKEVIDNNGNLPDITTIHSIALEYHNDNLTISPTQLLPEVISYITTTGFNDLTEITTKHYIKNESESTTKISLNSTTENLYSDNVAAANVGPSTMRPNDSSAGNETEIIIDNEILLVITTAHNPSLEHDNDNLTISPTHLFPEVISYSTSTGYNDLTETTTQHYIENESELTANISSNSTTENMYPDNIAAANFGSSTMRPNDSSAGDEIEVIVDNEILPVITTAHNISLEHHNDNLTISPTHLFPEVISYISTTGYNDLTETTSNYYFRNESQSTTNILLNPTTENIYADNITTDNFGSTTIQPNDSSVGVEKEVADNDILTISTSYLFPEVMSNSTSPAIFPSTSNAVTPVYSNSDLSTEIQSVSELINNISLDLTTEKMFSDNLTTEKEFSGNLTTDNIGSSTIQPDDSSVAEEKEIIEDNGNFPVITTAQGIFLEDYNDSLAISTTYIFPEVMSNSTSATSSTVFSSTPNTVDPVYSNSDSSTEIQNESEPTTHISLDLTTEKIFLDNLTTNNFGSSTVQPNDSSVGDEIEVIDDNGNLPVITTAPSNVLEHDNDSSAISTTYLFPEVMSNSTSSTIFPSTPNAVDSDAVDSDSSTEIQNESESTANISLDLTTEKVFSDNLTTDNIGSSTMQPNNSSVEDEKEVIYDNGNLSVITTAQSNDLVLEDDNDSLATSTTYLFPEVISNNTTSTIYPSVDADHSNSDSSTEIPSNLPSYENTTPLIVNENSDSNLIDEDDQFTQTEASDHSQVPFDLDQEAHFNSALKIEFSFVLCASLFAIYAVV